MAFTKEFQDGTSPGISAALLNEPFHITDATSYDGTNDDLNIVVGPGRADFGSGAFVEKLSDTTVTVSAPAASTTYYVFLRRDGTFRTSTSSARNGDARLGSVTTASDKTVSSRDDLRGILVPSAETLDHGQLQGKGDDDHPQYLDSTRHDDGEHSGVNHHALAGLGDDDHPQYVLVSGDTMSGDLNLDNNYLIYNDSGSGNVDHVYHDDGANTYHLVSDGSRGAKGNATVQAGAYKAGNNTVLHEGNATAEASGVVVGNWSDGGMDSGGYNTEQASITIPSHWGGYTVVMHVTFDVRSDDGADIEVSYAPLWNGNTINVGGSSQYLKAYAHDASWSTETAHAVTSDSATGTQSFGLYIGASPSTHDNKDITAIAYRTS